VQRTAAGRSAAASPPTVRSSFRACLVQRFQNINMLPFVLVIGRKIWYKELGIWVGGIHLGTAMRPIALSRKNALFAGPDAGAANWACIASLIETALCRARHRPPSSMSIRRLGPPTPSPNSSTSGRPLVLTSCCPWAYPGPKA
jgi:hypothetical protein